MATGLRNARIRALMTQDELAAAAGITTRALRSIELGYARPQFSTVRSLARALSCEPSELVDEEEVAA